MGPECSAILRHGSADTSMPAMTTSATTTRKSFSGSSVIGSEPFIFCRFQDNLDGRQRTLIKSGISSLKLDATWSTRRLSVPLFCSFTKGLLWIRALPTAILDF